jgi:tetratricopeptide (TPR) repeat protein
LNLYTDAKEAVDPIVGLAIKRDYRKRLAQINIITGSYASNALDNFSDSKNQLEQALKISEEINDIVSFVFASYWLSISMSLNCEFEKAYHHIEKALEINMAVNCLWGISGMQSVIGMINYWHGRINLAYQFSNKAQKIAEKSGDIYSKALAHGAHGISCYGKNLLEEAAGHLVKGADFSERLNMFIWDSVARFNLAEVYFDMREYQKSHEYYREVVSLLERGGAMPSFLNLSRIGEARAKLMNYGKDINLEFLYNCHAKNKVRLFDEWMSRYIGEILLNIDDKHITEAEYWVKKSIETNQKYGMLWQLARGYSLYAELFQQKGDSPKVKENLGKAIEIFREYGADGWVEKYEKELAKL